ncbi:hypothetical protein Nepgr_001943 [Nepenthes gracilis]|uniref:Uncharacterized protein n=1 Tax=Nepenthes gracilis TaxID=150966 RepID=A0AAD3P5C5_NEPGR|nr:hypothetical protein Nepgr_001943 [Nepenthes gracilis]
MARPVCKCARPPAMECLISNSCLILDGEGVPPHVCSGDGSVLPPLFLGSVMGMGSSRAQSSSLAGGQDELSGLARELGQDGDEEPDDVCSGAIEAPTSLDLPSVGALPHRSEGKGSASPGKEAFVLVG